MKKNINDVIANLNISKNISYQIIINLLILKVLSKKEHFYSLHFRTLWDDLLNIQSLNMQKDFFTYRYLPFLQNNHNDNDKNLSLVFRNMHLPFSYIDDLTLRRFIDLVEYLNEEEISEFINNISYESRLTYHKTLDTKIQRNIIKLLDIKYDDKVLDLNLISSNFLSLLKNDSYNNVGYIQNYDELSIRFLELLLSNNVDLKLILNDPLIDYHLKIKRHDVVFVIPPFSQRLSREEYSFDFPIQASMAYNLYIQKALLSLEYDGRCAIVVPDGFLNQINKETDAVRRFVFEKLVCIINLGPIFRPYSGINVSLLILKNDNYNDHILMANFLDNKLFSIDEFTNFSNQFRNCKFDLEKFNINNTKNILLVTKNEIIQNRFILDYKRYQPLEEIIGYVQRPETLIRDIESNTQSLLKSISNIKKIRNNLAHCQIMLNEFYLDEIASIRLGRPLLDRENIQNGNIPYVTISDITRCTTDYINSSELMINEAYAYNNLTIIKPNSILLSVRGTIGKVKITSQEIAISHTLVAIEIDSYKANPYFIYQWLLNKKEYFEANAVGTSQKSINTNFLKELKIKLSSREIQDKFEIYKNDFDNIKQTLSKLNDENQDLSKSIFSQFY